MRVGDLVEILDADERLQLGIIIKIDSYHNKKLGQMNMFWDSVYTVMTAKGTFERFKGEFKTFNDEIDIIQELN